MNRVVLIGFKSAGKTSAGRELAGLLQVPFYDLDELLESEAHRRFHSPLNCWEVYTSYGQEAFQELEHESLKIFAQDADRFCLATGGGAPLLEANRPLLHSLGTVVFLDVDFDIIRDRLLSRPRIPAPLKGMRGVDDLKKIWLFRRDIYLSVADITVAIRDSSLTPQQIAAMVLERLKSV
ncbi:MAG: hypothetical protein D6820_02375 [Lentisphaerae bacterium]|nr:MAG: hypothetical protein D6820_02375 [Lentisphaerota bacterium]